MDERRSDRRTLVAALAAEAGSAVEHPETDRLLDYFAGRLDPDAEESLRDHLVACRGCARRLLELEPLAEPDAGDEDAVADFAMNASLRALEARIESERAGSRGAPAGRAGRRGPLLGSPVFLRSLAAGLLVAVVGLSVWGLRLQGAAADLRRTLDDLDRPRANVAVSYLEPATSRGTAPAPAELEPGQPFWVLVLIPEDPRPRPEYEVTLLGADGEELWRQRGFEMSGNGGVSLSLPRRLLPPGEYRLRLHAIQEDQRTLVGEYPLRSPADGDSR